MKIYNITNPKELFKRLEECKGEVYLKTAEGDSLNMKSKLCQFIILSQMFVEANIKELELELTDQNDMPKIIDYLIRG